MESLKKETFILNFNHSSIQKLIAVRGWIYLNEIDQIKEIYNFVRDEIRFGYNTDDSIQASKVLKDGYGQCNTKATLLMALLRAVGIATRIHGFTIDKALQKGAIDGVWYKFSPKNILHSWVEVYVNKEWFILEGVIVDKNYLQQLKRINQDVKGTFCGFGVFTDNFSNPLIDWNLNNTFIQDKGINQDFGLFNSPDDFYDQHRQKLNFIQRLLFRHIVRHLMNKNVEKIRNLNKLG